MKINVKGQEVEAYALLMKKEFAKEIVEGKKILEWRTFSEFYSRMFTNEENQKLFDMGKLPEGENTIREDIEYVHFYSTGAPWTLDCSIHGITLVVPIKEDADWLHDTFGCDDLYPIVEECDKEGVPEFERPAWYVIVLNEVVGRKGI